MAGFPAVERRKVPQHHLQAPHYRVTGLTGAFSVAAEFEVPVRGTTIVSQTTGCGADPTGVLASWG